MLLADRDRTSRITNVYLLKSALTTPPLQLYQPDSADEGNAKNSLNKLRDENLWEMLNSLEVNRVRERHPKC